MIIIILLLLNKVFENNTQKQKPFLTNDVIHRSVY